MRKADIEQYTGEGEPPPAIEMMIKAESDRITPPDLTVVVYHQSTTSAKIEIKKEAQNVTACLLYAPKTSNDFISQSTCEPYISNFCRDLSVTC